MERIARSAWPMMRRSQSSRLAGAPRAGFTVLIGGLTPLLILAWLSIAGEIRDTPRQRIALAIGAVAAALGVWLSVVLLLDPVVPSPLLGVVSMLIGGLAAYPFVHRLLPAVGLMRYGACCLAGVALMAWLEHLFPMS